MLGALNNEPWRKGRFTSERSITVTLYIVHILKVVVLLEELQTVAWDDSHVAKVNEVHLYVSGAEDLVDHHPVEPHSFWTHAANLATPDESFRQAVTFRHLGTLVTSSK